MWLVTLYATHRARCNCIPILLPNVVTAHLKSNQLMPFFLAFHRSIQVV